MTDTMKQVGGEETAQLVIQDMIQQEMNNDNVQSEDTNAEFVVVERKDTAIEAQDSNRSHHLLKHCLSEGQRIEALAHFGTDDIKEAAKDISKMGQRDLQNKFKLVYGNATHSNNNDWLRRKLYEAIGAAPVKVPSKTRVKKTNCKGKKTKSEMDMVPNSVPVGKLRSRKGLNGRCAMSGGAEAFARYRRGVMSLPSSPMVGRSVLDINRFLSNELTTSASDEETGSFPGNGNGGRIQKASSLESGTNSDFSPYPFASGLEFDSHSYFDGPSSLPLLFNDETAELELLDAYRKKSSLEDTYFSDSNNFFHSQDLKLEEEEDVMLVSVDLSAYNTVEGLM